MPLVLLTGVYTVVLARTAAARHSLIPRVEAVVLGSVANFFDTLGVGSFAPSMAWLKFRRLVPDRMIPATMLAGYTLPTVAESAIFLVLLGVGVDPVLLFSSIVSLTLGFVFGMPLAVRAPIRVVRAVVGLAMVLAAFLYALGNLHLMPVGGHATGLALPWLLVALAAQMALGVLVNFGVGHYAPTLIILSLMGMDPHLAFPIMASAGAFGLVTVGSRYVVDPKVDLKIVMGLALGGVPGVLVAAFLVKSMSVDLMRWMVVAVVLYAAARMLIDVARPGKAEAEA